MKLYAIRDRAVDSFMNIWQARTHEEAKRVYGQMMAQNEAIRTHADDFDLFYIGDYNDDNGTVQGLNEPPKMIWTGKECRTALEA